MSRKKKSSFRGKVNQDAERQKKTGSAYGYLNLPKGVSVFNPDPGKRYLLDFLPYEVTDEKHPDRNDDAEIAVPESLWYKRPFKVHRNVGADNDAVVCLASIGKKCPICEYRSACIRKGAEEGETDADFKKRTKALKQSMRNLYVVIPLDSKKHEEEPHIWDMSWWLFQDLLNDELNEDENYEVFPDLEEGLTLKVRFDSKTMGEGKPFADASRIDFEERDEQYTEEILKDVPNLDEVLTILSYKELHSKFFEMDEEEDEDNTAKPEQEEEEEEGKPRRKKKTVKKEVEEEPEEGKGKPKRTRRKKKDEEDENKCLSGYKFGVDCEDKDECGDCDSWNDCIEEKDKLG